jgi:hypothetical protein
MEWVLIIWLNSPKNFTVYEQFKTIEQCSAKQEIVQRAFKQADSKMNLECRKRKIGDITNKSNVMVKRYVLY